MFQLTLCILKPDVVRSSLCLMYVSIEEIIELILQRQFIFVKSKRLQLNRERAGEFYREHQGLFPILDSLFQSIVLRKILLQSTCALYDLWTDIMSYSWKENAIREWRSMLGPTKVFKTIFEAENTIRGQHGVTDTRNCGHGSDSNETAEREISFFFPEFDLKSQLKSANLSANKLVFNKDTLEHQF